MNRKRRFLDSKIGLGLLSGALMGVSFPPFHLEWLAFVALIPLLSSLEETDSYTEILKVSYFAFLVFNIIGLYWVGGWSKETDPFMMIGGAALVATHPFFFTVPILVYSFLKRKIGRTAVLIFPFLYLSFEDIHSITQVAFPWLTLGYSQCYNLAGIQFASVTGVFGVSLQILFVNSLSVYGIFNWLDGKPRSRRNALAFIAAALALVVVPEICGTLVLDKSSSRHYPGEIRVTIIQPNIDPYAKWAGTPTDILKTYESETYHALNHKADMVIWPETAIPFYILLPQFAYYRNELQTFVDTTGITLLSGLPLARYYMDSTEAKPSSHYDEFRRLYYDAYNGAALFEPHSDVYQTYGKIILVPFAERLPYADRLPFLIKPLKWGVGISNWARGTDTTVFKLPDGRKFSTVICYESIFPGYVREFAKKGADFLVIITNDGWYGNTSGPYQHAAYAIMRAIENRRSVVRSANTGISECIDPYGRYIGTPTKYGELATMTETVPLDNSLTYYSRNGNWIAHISEMISAASILFGLFLKLKQLRTRRDSDELH